jgi:hypothetical protein
MIAVNVPIIFMIFVCEFLVKKWWEFEGSIFLREILDFIISSVETEAHAQTIALNEVTDEKFDQKCKSSSACRTRVFWWGTSFEKTPAMLLF